MDQLDDASVRTVDGVIRNAQANLSALPEGPWDGRKLSYIPPVELNIDPSLSLHRDFDREIDPITYQVLRSRFWHNNLEHQDVIQRIAANYVVVRARDFAVALLTEDGEVVTIGPTIQYFSALSDFVVKWTLENRSSRPGIAEGDIFLQNDPFIGAAHQADTAIYGPVFWEGKLFCWVYNCCHIGDLGGVDPGGWAVNARDIFDEAITVPPMKIVSAGQTLVDPIETFVRQSREPNVVSLGVKSQIAGVEAMRRQLHEVLGRYGPGLVKGAMRKAIADCSKVVSERLRQIPDGTWRERLFVGGARGVEREVHREMLTLTKRGDQLTCSNAGTSEQGGPGNSPYGVLRSGVVAALQTALAYDQLGCTAGVANHVVFEPTPGTRTTPRHPAAVSALLSTLSGMAANSVVISKMLLSGPAEVREHANAAGGLALPLSDVVFGVDHDGNYVSATGLAATNTAGCIGAFPHRDGIDIGSSWWLLGTTTGNVEEGEEGGVGLVLFRGETPDSGGPGRWRGGNAPRNAFMPHKQAATMAQLSFIDPSVNTALGLAGGYYGLAGNFLRAGNTKLGEAMAAGRLPGNRADVEKETGGLERLHPRAFVSPFPNGDVVCVEYSGGGGYGDPLDREPERVCADVADEKISLGAAELHYGVVVDADGGHDAEATARTRAALRARRLAQAQHFPRHTPLGRADASATVLLAGAAGNVDVLREAAGATPVWACHGCGERLGEAGGNFKLESAYLECNPHEVDAFMYPDPTQETDAPIVLRQYICPGCGALLSQEFTQVGEPPLFDFEIVGIA
jgi:N-methylhydantoinase B